jgi:hypothetical protein
LNMKESGVTLGAYTLAFFCIIVSSSSLFFERPRYWLSSDAPIRQHYSAATILATQLRLAVHSPGQIQGICKLPQRSNTTYHEVLESLRCTRVGASCRISKVSLPRLSQTHGIRNDLTYNVEFKLPCIAEHRTYQAQLR